LLLSNGFRLLLLQLRNQPVDPILVEDPSERRTVVLNGAGAVDRQIDDLVGVAFLANGVDHRSRLTLERQSGGDLNVAFGQAAWGLGAVGDLGVAVEVDLPLAGALETIGKGSHIALAIGLGDLLPAFAERVFGHGRHVHRPGEKGLELGLLGTGQLMVGGRQGLADLDVPFLEGVGGGGLSEQQAERRYCNVHVASPPAAGPSGIAVAWSSLALATITS